MSKGRCCSSGCDRHVGCGGGVGGVGGFGGDCCLWIIIILILCSCNGFGGKC